MNRFPREGRRTDMAEHAGSFNASLRGVDDQGSVSGSEDDAASYYLPYPDPHKMDTDIDDDANTSLTSQTLNADGTPKRPMNAFMIFARRRRPQVSAENQSMRTGDVSKILSREWNAMDLSEKQFYLDQAKQLKDNFNLKYPDYVYRRRPNNSRKKRRPDSVVPADSASGDLVDEQFLHGEISPVDYHDSQERHESSRPEGRYSSVPPEVTYDASYLPPQSADSSLYYPYGGDRRAPYTSSHERVSPDTVMEQSTPSAARYPHFSNAPNTQTCSYFQGQPGSEGQWHLSRRSSREDLGGTHVQSWSQSVREPSLHPVDDRHRQYQLAQVSPTSWPSASPSEPLASNSSPVHAPYSFPTLNSPFYPSQSSSHNPYVTQHSPSQMSDTPQQYDAVSHVQATSRQGAAYHGHHYSSVSTMQSEYQQSSGPTMHPYHTHTRPAQSIPIYHHQQSMNTTSSAGSVTDPSPQLQ
ncbi:hypothetical protein K503DRAFT_771265 [Rhizopogon vinicolor AM-OR11-026]|uniref:HMG box domain-containing protein n=1 Tax=Rhizopogon vinicolor AM-OR11-026 TaxID=1314800 RepID=A0A1B7MYL6_9AGAM|nr:hypothetical protein K503DRAFT_771265 [Rhizopogon vinicolor AM-OR11-026]